MTERERPAVTYIVAPGVCISSSDPAFTEERARTWHREVCQLAREGKYEFSGTTQSEDGVTTYLYKFALSESPHFMFGSQRPIEELGLLDVTDSTPE